MVRKHQPQGDNCCINATLRVSLRDSDGGITSQSIRAELLVISAVHSAWKERRPEVQIFTIHEQWRTSLLAGQKPENDKVGSYF